MTYDKMIEVLLAAERGEQIQKQTKYEQTPWEDDPEPSWNFGIWRYRVKPKPREWWVSLFHNGKPRAISEGPVKGWIKTREVIE